VPKFSLPKPPTVDPPKLFAALSDRTRLRLLNLLRDGERCVCDLVEGVDASQPTVSRHLALLRRAGLVDARREGLWIHYQLAPRVADLLEKLYDCLSEASACCPEFLHDEKRIQAARKARGCCD